MRPPLDFRSLFLEPAPDRQGAGSGSARSAKIGDAARRADVWGDPGERGDQVLPGIGAPFVSRLPTGDDMAVLVIFEPRRPGSPENSGLGGVFRGRTADAAGRRSAKIFSIGK
jgi:hypothetical protein